MYSVLRQVRSPFRSEFKQSAIYCFLFPFRVPCLLLKVVQYLLLLSPRLTLTYNFISIFPSVTCFKRQFLRKMGPIHCSFFSLFVELIFDKPGPIYQYRDIKTKVCNCKASVHFGQAMSWQPINNFIMQISIFVLFSLPVNLVKFRYTQPADGLTYSKIIQTCGYR